LVRELVLADTVPFVPLVMKKRGKEIDYEAKTDLLHARRQPRYSCGRRCAAAHRARRLSLVPETEM
jgi:hypothetical protein